MIEHYKIQNGANEYGAIFMLPAKIKMICILSILGILLCDGSNVMGADVIAIVPKNKTGLMVDLNKKYLLEVAYFFSDEKNISQDFDNDFRDELKQARLIYAGQFSEDSAFRIINRYESDIRQFLTSGGAIYFDYRSLRPEMNPFFATLKVHNPYHSWGTLKGRDYVAVIHPDFTTFPVFNTPHQIHGKLSGYGWWENTPPEQLPLIVNEKNSNGAGLMMQERVLEKGTVIFSHIPLIFRARKGYTQLLENLLSYIFKEDILALARVRLQQRGGPGRDVPLQEMRQ